MNGSSLPKQMHSWRHDTGGLARIPQKCVQIGTIHTTIETACTAATVGDLTYNRNFLEELGDDVLGEGKDPDP